MSDRPGEENDERLYATACGGKTLHILRDDGSGYFDAGTLCGVWRNLGKARGFPDPEFADQYRVCPQCRRAEDQNKRLLR